MIAGLSTVVALPVGRPVCEQGEFGRQFFVVREGTFEVERDGERITTLRPGDWFGEMSLSLRCPRLATVTSATPASLRVFSAREYRSLLAACPEVGRGIDAAIEDRIDELHGMALAPPPVLRSVR
jgi:CRP-like cAMP-binding protein